MTANVAPTRDAHLNDERGQNLSMQIIEKYHDVMTSVAALHGANSLNDVSGQCLRAMSPNTVSEHYLTTMPHNIAPRQHLAAMGSPA